MCVVCTDLAVRAETLNHEILEALLADVDEVIEGCDGHEIQAQWIVLIDGAVHQILAHHCLLLR